MERKFVEAKFTTQEDGAIAGVAWKFDQADRVGDVIERGAFKAARTPLPMLFSHDGGDPVGVWESAVETREGLQVDGRLLVEDVQRAREVRALVTSGAVRGISIGFIPKNAIKRSGGGRTIKALELLEASLVAVPMHAGAEVTSAKSAIEALTLTTALKAATTKLARH